MVWPARQKMSISHLLTRQSACKTTVLILRNAAVTLSMLCLLFLRGLSRQKKVFLIFCLMHALEMQLRPLMGYRISNMASTRSAGSLGKYMQTFKQPGEDKIVAEQLSRALREHSA